MTTEKVLQILVEIIIGLFVMIIFITLIDSFLLAIR